MKKSVDARATSTLRSILDAAGLSDLSVSVNAIHSVRSVWWNADVDDFLGNEIVITIPTNFGDFRTEYDAISFAGGRTFNFDFEGETFKNMFTNEAFERLYNAFRFAEKTAAAQDYRIYNIVINMSKPAYDAA